MLTKHGNCKPGNPKSKTPLEFYLCAEAVCIWLFCIYELLFSTHCSHFLTFLHCATSNCDRLRLSRLNATYFTIFGQLLMIIFIIDLQITFSQNVIY